MKRQLEIALAVITIGGALIVIAQLETTIAGVVKLPPEFYQVTSLFGVTLTGGGLLIALLGAAALVTGKVGEIEYRCDALAYGEIPGFLEFCQQFFSDELPPLERIQSWHKKNSHVLYYVRRRRRVLLWVFEKIVGCFGVLPVNEASGKRLGENSLIGREFHSDDIVAPTEFPAAYYIGILAAKGFRNKRETLLALLGHINAKLEAKRVPLYTRPITKDGERLVSKYNFAPVVSGFSRPKDVIFCRV